MSTIEHCLFAICVIVFIGLIFAIVAYLIHITKIMKFKRPDEVMKVDKKGEPPFLRSYSVCASVEIEKLEIVENYSPLELKTIITLLEAEMLFDETGHPYTREYIKRFVRRINEKDS